MTTAELHEHLRQLQSIDPQEIGGRSGYVAMLLEEIIANRHAAKMALVVNRQFGDELDTEEPVGWMSPSKREKIIAALKNIAR